MRTSNCSVSLIFALLACSVYAEETAIDPPATFVAVDLSEKSNFGYGSKLTTLANKSHTFDGVQFTLRSRGLRVRGDYFPDDPAKIENVKVDRAVSRLHILHATEHGARGHRFEGHTDYVEDGTLIGQYHVLYEDGLIEVIPIVYGEDVRDWWNWDMSKPCKRGKVAWEGRTPRTRNFNMTVRLYMTTWVNPRPDEWVASITMVSTGDSAASPFCIAMTTEDSQSEKEALPYASDVVEDVAR